MWVRTREILHLHDYNKDPRDGRRGLVDGRGDGNIEGKREKMGGLFFFFFVTVFLPCLLPIFILAPFPLLVRFVFSFFF
jgi:hypothetical protein